MEISRERGHFCKFATMLLEDVPRNLRDIFKQSWNRKFSPKWGDDEASGKCLKTELLNSKTSFPNSTMRDCVCKGNIQIWDCTSLFFVLIFSKLNLLTKDEKQHVHKLRLMRNELFHKTVAELSTKEFDDAFAVLEIEFNFFGWNTSNIKMIKSGQLKIKDQTELDSDIKAEKHRIENIEMQMIAFAENLSEHGDRIIELEKGKHEANCLPTR